MSFQKTKSILNKTIDTERIREELGLEPILEDMCVYLMLEKLDSGKIIHKNWETDIPNYQAYCNFFEKEKLDGIIKTTAFEDLPPQYQFVICEMDTVDSLLDDLSLVFCQDENLTGIFSCENEVDVGVFYVKLTNVWMKYETDYFGEIDGELVYEDCLVDKNDIPKDILDELYVEE